MSAPYVGLGETDPNHPLEVEGQVFISNVEQGTTTNSVPFEVYSDYDGASTSQLRGARQMRLRVSPSTAPTSNVNIDMGIEPQTGSYLYIGNPVTNTALSSNSAFRVQASGDIYMGNDLRVVGTITTSNIEGASPITINAGADPVKIIGAGGVSVTGGVSVAGGVSALSLTGSGAALTTLNASNISTGTLNLATVSASSNLRIGSWISHIDDNSAFGFSGTDTISFKTNDNVKALINNSGLSATALTGSGAGITAINPGNITAGTINMTTVSASANLRIGSWISHINDNSAFGFSGTDTISFKTNDNVRALINNSGLSATALTGSGAAISSINPGNITAGTINMTTVSASSNLRIGSWISHIDDNSAFGFSGTDTISFKTNDDVRALINNSGLSATALTGSGAAISSINASSISTGTINNSRLPTTISRTLIKGTTISATGDVYGSRFIDRNSTSYLCNPYGASLFRELNLRDAYGLTFSAGTSYWIVQHLGNTVDLRFEYKGSNRMYLFGTTGNLSIDGTYSTFSDERLKDNILDVDDAYALNVIKNLKPKTYNWKDQTKGKDLQYGFIAQDIEKLYPEMVSKIEGVIPTDQTTYPSQITSNTTMEVTMTDVSTWSSGDKIVIENSENDSKTLTIHEIQGNVLSLSAEKISSNFVNENNETYIKGKSVKDVLTINTNGLDPLMISAIQQLERRVTELENKLAS